MSYEIRDTSGEVRHVGGKIRGTASPVYDGTSGTEYRLYGNTYERFAPGAFDDCLRDSPDVLACYNHDEANILGRTPETLILTTDNKGLHYEIDPPDTRSVKDLKKLIDRHDLRGSSIRFGAVDTKWEIDGKKEIRLITKANLAHIAIVARPAYGSSTAELRSEERAVIEKEKADYYLRLETEKRVSRFKTNQKP